jgi:hypothetical protein
MTFTTPELPGEELTQCKPLETSQSRFFHKTCDEPFCGP